MSDLISRKTALEHAEACKFTDKNEKRKFMDWLNYCLDAAIEPQWLPCSERLPECDYDTVLCVTDTDFWAVMVYTKEHGFRSGDIDFSGEVTAWMPLPEPYKGEQHGTD